MTGPLAFDEDVVLAKASTVRSCLTTIRQVHASDRVSLEEWMRRDLEILNLQRAAQACLDLVHHLIASNRWELPRDGGHAMSIAARHGVIDGALETTMRGVIGFRNVAVHLYTEIDPEILGDIVEHRLGDLERFVAAVLECTLKSGR